MGLIYSISFLIGNFYGIAHLFYLVKNALKEECRKIDWFMLFPLAWLQVAAGVQEKSLSRRKKRRDEKISWYGPSQRLWSKKHANTSKINCISGKFKEDSRSGILLF